MAFSVQRCCQTCVPLVDFEHLLGQGWRHFVILIRNHTTNYVLIGFHKKINNHTTITHNFITKPPNLAGAICNNDSQFICGLTSLCISSYLVCDGVRHCPGGEDEDPSACSHRHDPPLLELLRRFAARNQELLGLDQPDGMTKPSVISEYNFSIGIFVKNNLLRAFLQYLRRDFRYITGDQGNNLRGLRVFMVLCLHSRVKCYRQSIHS